jgi:glucose-1-phosphate cytidylyltransferase
MKVVLFCGGLGTRLREHSDTIPKPLVNIGVRPIIWHLMRYYAHYGHKDFILCLGYRGEMIREYFLNYNECLSNDFVLSNGGRRASQPLRATCTTGASRSSTPGCTQQHRPAAAEGAQVPGDDEEFLANYSDGLTDLPLDRHIERLPAKRSMASFVATRTSQSFHCVQADDDGTVQPPSAASATPSSGSTPASSACAARSSTTSSEGDELVEQPFQRLIEKRSSRLPYRGFWQQMDTFATRSPRPHGRPGDCPWMVWKPLKRRDARRHAALCNRPRPTAPAVLCLGAHSDDIEIGCAGTLLRLAGRYAPPAGDLGRLQRRRAARAGGAAQRAALLRGARAADVVLGDFADGSCRPVRARQGLHARRGRALHARRGADAPPGRPPPGPPHRGRADLATWRDHLVLEYEIPKYEGDLGQPNFYVPLPAPLPRASCATC